MTEEKSFVLSNCRFLRWPGALDNSVAGGISAGDQPMESMIRECGEEAGLSPELVKKHIKVSKQNYF